MAEQPSTSSPNRFERRRAATRQALIAAARQILAERADGDGEVSIQEIAERADVGFGSFYNHFSSKGELFDAAVGQALEEYGTALDTVVGGIEDPAETFAASVRLTIAMVESHPEIMRILRRSGLGHIHSDSGLAPRALRDIEKAAASGRFSVADPQVALAAVGGALLGLIDLRLRHPERTAPDAGEQMAELVLRMLGMAVEDAHEIARRPLPTTPA
ncbi:TetR family transcriptional regulator [Streptomyces sp. TLI_235]|nr:TetR/AcrR family transcriptional regulator [Streptomyces sp. TLI_235]PBC71072.1 TetR family transcriptional regulator [Streptomyces sp. TLI_235]